MNIKVINNFLFKEDFTELSQLILKKTQKEEINVYHNSIGTDGIKINECIEKKTLIRLYKNYHNRAIQLLTELSPKKVGLYEYSEFHIIETGKNYKFPIHDDTPNKLLSGVIYLMPKKNVGTLFYDNKTGANKKEINWLQNRAVFFSRTEGQSWHSYEGDKLSNRIALVYNLMTTDIKAVCKIEKKIICLQSLDIKLIHTYIDFLRLQYKFNIIYLCF